MVRGTTIRVNHEELQAVKDLRDDRYPDYPLGAVVRELAESASE